MWMGGYRGCRRGGCATASRRGKEGLAPTWSKGVGLEDCYYPNLTLYTYRTNSAPTFTVNIIINTSRLNPAPPPRFPTKHFRVPWSFLKGPLNVSNDLIHKDGLWNWKNLLPRTYPPYCIKLSPPPQWFCAETVNLGGLQSPSTMEVYYLIYTPTCKQCLTPPFPTPFLSILHVRGAPFSTFPSILTHPSHIF